ncbi:MAG TPA: trimeric intracellular cation channel family protein, partial [Pyrinomonadaceae bacterium]|nr:trimeric intracellular cation channel family protein [Pyrinomonadaceae bacterium]
MDNLTAAFKEYAASTLLVLDLLGTFVFALSGAVVGVKRRLDIFGVLVLSFAAATAGGIMRDVLIGSTPPAAIRDWRYMAASVLGGLLIFVWFPRSQQSSRVRNFVLLFDAGGLALFAVTGTQKALGYGLNPLMAALLGMLTGVGGGILRDVLVAEIPHVLRSDLYAVAALAGAVTVIIGQQLDLAPTV